MTEIDVPEGVEVEVSDGRVRVSGPEGEVERPVSHPKVAVKVEEGYVRVEAENGRKDEQAAAKGFASHVQNMIHGVTDGFEYRLKVFYSHFPIQVDVQGDRVQVENFLGEKEPRYSDVLDGAEVRVDGEDITVSGSDKEAVGQTAANLEQATTIKGKDPRVFQDGIYIIEG